MTQDTGGRAMSEEAMLASLRDITLPLDAPGGVVAELAAVVGLAALLALVVAAVLRALSHARQPAPLQGVAAALAEAEALEGNRRRVAYLHLLRVHAPARYSALRDKLYRPEDTLSLADLEAEVRRLV